MNNNLSNPSFKDTVTLDGIKTKEKDSVENGQHEEKEPSAPGLEELEIANNSKDNAENSLFDARTMPDWIKIAKLKPPIEPLYSPWWNRGETCFFFGVSGIGKTIYAIQMAIEISKKYKVLFFDFELTDVQLLKRYGLTNPEQVFNDNFIRLEMQKDKIAEPKKIFNEIRNKVVEEKPDVIIIDNISWILRDGQEAKNAIPFMQGISTLKKEEGVSILIIAHTVKKKALTKYEKGYLRSYYEPLTLSDMAGSAALNNFIDSCFAIGKSLNESSYRYLKQLKNRSGENKHEADNVMTIELIEKKNKILWFDTVGYVDEEQHILSTPASEREAIIQSVISLKKQGLSNRKIAKELNISHTTVSRYLQNQKKKP